jgi:predicted RNase H-like nuclease (RuvC/YqgF family)
MEPNIETIFEKADYPYERLKLRRKDQVHLLEKTAQYINTLKKTINEKNRKIKALEKRLASNRNNDLPLKSLEEGDTDDFDVEDQLSDFNDNYSVKVYND